MKKVLGVFITICIFVLNFVNMSFANTEKLSKPPRVIKNTVDSNRVDLQTGKPVPARTLGVQPRIRSTDDKHIVLPEVGTDLNEEVFPKVEMDIKFD